MATAVERVLASAADPPLLHPGDALVVLVSGGRDSVCLLDLAVTLCGPDGLLVLHVNYGLRGAESDGDEDYVRRLCRDADVEVDVCRASAPPVRGNVQAWARDLRYVEAVSRARGRGARIAAGHTATDQAETVLYRLAASPGRRALLGMAPVDGLLIRPLLGVTREQVADYCRQRGLAWRDDSTNGAARYARNRCRHGLAAALAELHPAAVENLVRTARLLRDEAAVLDEVATTALAGRDRISLARLAELPPALARLVVIRLAEDAAGRLVPGVGGRVGELLAMAPRGGSAQLDIGGGVSAVVEYGVLRIAPAGTEAPPSQASLSIPGSVSFGRWRLDCELAPPDPDDHRPVPVDPVVDRPRGAPAGDRAVPQTGRFDADLLEPAGLTVRPWRAGDRIAPLGLGGTKSLADLFVDRRVPRAKRRTLPVVASGHEVVWVPGLATAERFRVSRRTTRIAVLRAFTDPGDPEPGQ